LQNNLNKYQICIKCVMDTTVPGIYFDEKGECNYCKLHNSLDMEFPQNEIGALKLKNYAEKIKQSKGNNEYDCIIGVSGGVDSSYLLHLSVELGLKPLAVHLDNGWNSDISTGNIKKVLQKLNIDLRTYVIDWEEMKEILASYIRAGFAWADGPTDQAITATLYKIANEEGIKFIIVGNDFRSEGTQPNEWTWTDNTLLRAIVQKFSKIKLNTFPDLTLYSFVWYSYIKGIKLFRPIYFLNYNKNLIKIMLQKEYDWEDYGGHHHESIFTRFIVGYWLPQKCGIDKRKVTYSAQIRSGYLIREEALSKLMELPYSIERMNEDKDYICKKLEISKYEFESIMKQPYTTFLDWPSNYNILDRYFPIIHFLFKYLLPWKVPFLTMMADQRKRERLDNAKK